MANNDKSGPPGFQFDGGTPALYEAIGRVSTNITLADSIDDIHTTIQDISNCVVSLLVLLQSREELQENLKIIAELLSDPDIHLPEDRDH